MAARLNVLSDLKLLKLEIKRSTQLDEPVDQVFVVYAVERFLIDPRFSSYIKSEDSQQSFTNKDGYDLTITDRQFKLKCVLSPLHNKRVQRGEIAPGKLVRLTKCSLLYDETDLTGLNFIVIHKLDVLYEEIKQTARDGGLDVNHITWCPNSCEREKDEAPLVAQRGCYVWTWSPYETYGQVWQQSVTLTQSISSDIVGELYTLRELSKHWRSLKLSSLPPLLVRVMTKSRLRHYAKPFKADKWPYQVYIVVADRSGSCLAVIWNSLCAKLYHNVQEGSVILLENYTVKPHFSAYSYQNSRRSKVSDLSHYDIDLNLNPHHPETRIKIIPESTVDSDWELPPLEYEFVTRRQLGFLPANFICDIVGVVINVGRYERISPVCTDTSQRDDTFWVIRWLELVDQSALEREKTFLIKLFRSVQGDTLDDLYPGQVLLCSHLRVVSSERTESKQTHYVYLTSTGETQLTVLQEDMESYSDPIITELFNWEGTSEAKSVVKDSTIGGYFFYPPLPSELNRYKELYTEKNSLQIIPSDQWESLLKNLSFRESRSVVVQCFFIKISHFQLNNKGKGKQTKSVKNDGFTFKEVLKYDNSPEDFSNMKVFGNSSLDRESLPYKYTPRNRERLLKRMAFPPSVWASSSISKTEIPVSMDDGFSYFSVILMGLNRPVALQAIQFHSNLTKDFTVQDALCRRLTPPTSNVNSNNVTSLSNRWLCHLDLYQIDSDRTEVILNAAYPLS